MMVARKPVSGKAKRVFGGLAVEINRTVYIVVKLSQEMLRHPAYRIVKKDGTHYDIHVDEHGPHCTCADYVYARQWTAKKCKHVEGLKALAFLEGV